MYIKAISDILIEYQLLICSLITAIFSIYITTFTLYKLAPKEKLVRVKEKFYSGVNQFTYSYQHNGIRDRIISTINLMVPPEGRIKSDELGRIIPGDKARFYFWAKTEITRIRHHQDIKIEDFEPVEDLRPDGIVKDPNRIESIFAEHNQKIEQNEDLDEYSRLELDITENNKLIRSAA